MLMKSEKATIGQYIHRIWRRARAKLFPPPSTEAPTRVCVIVPTFPTMGGTMTVLQAIAGVTRDVWNIEFLTQFVWPNRESYIIHRFGTRSMAPWYFPFAWLYFFAGMLKLFSLMRRGVGYHILMPQDGVFSGALAGLVGKLTGVRVVCIDHGDISLFTPSYSRIIRKERVAAIVNKDWPRPVRFAVRTLLMFYWPSRWVAAHIAARFIDCYLIPGVAGDGVEEVLTRLGVQASRIIRFANMIDVERHIIPDALLRAQMREKYDIPPDAIVIAIICRLAPEKGLEIALEAISQALSTLSPEIGKRVRIIVAGDGPLRKRLEEDIRLRGLGQACLLWGGASPEEVITILGLSDIFLFTSWRAAGYPLAVLEAMASSCAVIAATDSLANQEMLAERRGVVLPVGDTDGTAKAIVQLVSDPELCRRMGQLARDYVAIHHSPAMLKRALMRATFWSDEFLKPGVESKV